MFYFLYHFFDINIFQYITVRAGISFFIGFGLAMYLMPKYIAWAIAKKTHQPINKYVPNHESKKNTPTMGGVVFILSTVIAVILSANLTNAYVLMGIFTLVGFGYVGFRGDIGKILTGDNLKGLSSRAKMVWLFGMAFVIASFLIFVMDFSTQIYVPFVKTPIVDLGYFAILFWVFVFLATSNAVNLTDGLDGLAAVPSGLALLTLSIIVYVTGNAVLADYLLMPKIIGVGETVVIASALVGSLIGFLWYNSYPAEIFMGDTGSLALGGILTYFAILGKSEALLLVIGVIFVIETVSVILQVWSYRYRGKRIFLMAPIHHHFEMKKWAENKIIVRFWMISFIANLLALITLKIR